jgi:cytochrome b subunit of formate dehydrogenase
MVAVVVIGMLFVVFLIVTGIVMEVCCPDSTY